MYCTILFNLSIGVMYDQVDEISVSSTPDLTCDTPKFSTKYMLQAPKDQAIAFTLVDHK